MDKKEKNKCQRNFLTFIFCLFVEKNINNLMINIKNILTNEYMERMMKLKNIKRRRYPYGKTKENGKKSLCMEIL